MFKLSINIIIKNYLGDRIYFEWYRTILVFYIHSRRNDQYSAFCIIERHSLKT